MEMDPFFFPSSASSPSSSSLDGLQFWDPSFDLLAASDHLLPLPSPQAQRSAFSRCADPATSSHLWASLPQPRSSRNIHRRVIELMRSIQKGNQEKKGARGSRGSDGWGREGSRGFRHMMRERQRRERLSQSYADLYAMLSPRTKADKNSIVQAATAMVKEMKGLKEGLQKRNEELVRRAAAAAAEAEGINAGNDRKMDVGGEGVLTLQAANPASPLDSVIAALHCLESMDVKARAIRSEFAGDSGGWMTTFLTVETNKGGGEMDVQRMLAAEGWWSMKKT